MTKYGLTNGLLRTAPAIALAAAVTLGVATDARATDHQWGSYHFNKDGVTVLEVDMGDCHSPGGYGWKGIWDTAVNDWNTYSGDYLYFNKVGCGAGDVNSYDDNYGNTGWLGVANIWITRGKNKHIIEGMTRVNEYYITYVWSDGTPYTGFNEYVEFRHVECQEIGHTFGVDHNYGETCMNTDDRPLRYPSPNDDDATLLTTMYEHDHGGGSGDGGETAKPCNRAGKPAGCVPSGAPRGHVVWAEHYETNEEMFDAADAVIDATVLSSSFDRMVGRGQGAVPVTRVVLRVEDTLSGFTRSVIVLEQTRGPGLELHDDPGYVQGDGYTLYLREIGANTYRTVNPDGRIRQ